MLCPGHNCRFSSLLARSAISEGSSSDSDDHSNSPRQDRHLLSSIRLSAGFFGSIVDIVNKKACFGNKSSALLNVSLLLSVYLFCPRAHLAPPLGPVPSRSSPVPLSLSPLHVDRGHVSKQLLPTHSIPRLPTCLLLSRTASHHRRLSSSTRKPRVVPTRIDHIARIARSTIIKTSFHPDPTAGTFSFAPISRSTTRRCHAQTDRHSNIGPVREL